jgi:exopolysaccharide biosynthesis polyprenyl glycosylphosphotransferase
LVTDAILLEGRLDRVEIIQWTKNIGIYFLIHFAIAGSFKLVLLTWFKNLVVEGKVFFNTLMVGGGPNAFDLYEELGKNNKYLGLKFLGFVPVSGSIEQQPLSQTLPALGSVSDINTLMKSHKIEHLVIAVEASDHAGIAQVLNQAEGTPARVSIIPDVYQILLGSVKVYHLLGTPLIEIKQHLMPVWQQVLKRTMDIVVSLGVLIVGFPFLLIIGIITKVTSKGPMFFWQERIGKDGLPFMIIKFRSMVVNAEKSGPSLSSDTDPRVTPWGRFMRKTRLDEFPQFYNVLIGDMSLVGPRPERQFFIDLIVLKAPHYIHLNRVRPGITSLGQVKYGYASNVDEMVRRLKFDILYIENMSLWMDLRIIAYTVVTILKGSGK